MIALDTSALLAIITAEPESEVFGRIVLESDCIIGAPTVLETSMVLRGRANAVHVRQFEQLLAVSNISVVDFSRAHAESATLAFEKFGRGSGHGAKLNFGDCMAYAIAKVARAPLLFKGDDFAATDIAIAFQP